MMPVLDLTPDMIVRDGHKVIAHRVESIRAKEAASRRRRQQIAAAMAVFA